MNSPTSNKLRVAVVFGGKSAEHEVSLQSARNVIANLDPAKYDPVLIGIDKSGTWYLNRNSDFLLNADNPADISLKVGGERVSLLPYAGTEALQSTNGGSDADKVDVVFPVLHGPFGEDGSIQGLVKLAGLPCVGAGILGSAVGMDKDVMKRLLRDAGIDIAPYRCLTRTAREGIDAADLADELGLPLFVKPANLGSSVGITKVETVDGLAEAVELAFGFDTKILIEQGIVGREVECAVLGNDDPQASVPGEVLPNASFYSYEAKYLDENGAALKIPAEVTPEESDAIRNTAVAAFKALCCSGMARVDSFLTADGRVVVNEINTIPGFTRISMYPMLWKASGIAYPELIDRLIELALERHAAETALRTSYR